ncbi:hypothetical protein WD019_12830 [Fictibacillus sp. Mic-4]|uniref:hypothetical protein n=1 Tax=Fictibacillus TaxID=1329200 RepID=UPI00041994DF|nr:hypothetical protein [Fictibacillus gelatini]
MGKRKQPRDAARNNNFTPTESMDGMDITDKSFADAEIPKRDTQSPRSKEK